MAANMDISRTIVHIGIIELSSMGLLTINPRKGTYVNDYRVDGTVSILESLLDYKGELQEELLDSLLQSRYLLEVENAGLAASKRTDEDLKAFEDIISKEEAVDISNIDEIVNIDFLFHHRISVATGNMVYPLLIKPFEGTYKNLTGRFFRENGVVPVVFKYHKRLYSAIRDGLSSEAEEIMKKLLKHGEDILKLQIKY
jgi:DNA-binding FadR family transcriptional regulator